MNRTANFAKVDLTAAGFYRHDASGFTHRDISALGGKLRFSANPRGANMSTARVQIRIAVNISGIDVPTGCERVQIGGRAFHLNMPALRFQFRHAACSESLL